MIENVLDDIKAEAIELVVAPPKVNEEVEINEATVEEVLADGGHETGACEEGKGEDTEAHLSTPPTTTANLPSSSLPKVTHILLTLLALRSFALHYYPRY